MFVDEFEKAWTILRSEGTVYDSPHLNVTLNTGRVIPDARLYNKKEYKDDNGTVTRREAIFMSDDGLHAIPLEDIVTLKIM
jgi:hypothetical protein